MAENTAPRPTSIESDESPWPVPPVEGLPFGKNSDEARAIERVIEQAEREQRVVDAGQEQ